MGEAPLDRIYIRDLMLRCIVGVYTEERDKKQDVVINITLEADLSTPCRTDQLEETVDYKDLKLKVVAMVEGSSFLLIERLAGAVADLCLEQPLVRRVTVAVDKPGALRFARSVAVEIVRERQSPRE